MTETTEHRMFCKWLNYQYPNILFMSDYYSFLSQKSRLTLVSLRKKGMTDIFIAEPNEKYKGLFIEIKRTGTKIFNKKGEFVNEHIQEQAEILDKLILKGYCATFGIGYTDCTEIVKKYLRNEI